MVTDPFSYLFSAPPFHISCTIMWLSSVSSFCFDMDSSLALNPTNSSYCTVSLARSSLSSARASAISFALLASYRLASLISSLDLLLLAPGFIRWALLPLETNGIRTCD